MIIDRGPTIIASARDKEPGECGITSNRSSGLCFMAEGPRFGLRKFPGHQSGNMSPVVADGPIRDLERITVFSR